MSFKDKYREKGVLLVHYFTGAERRPHENHKEVRENVLKKKIVVPKRWLLKFNCNKYDIKHHKM